MRRKPGEYAGALSRHLTEGAFTQGILRVLPFGSSILLHFPNTLKPLLRRGDACERALRMLARLPLDIRLHSSRVATLSFRTAQKMNLEKTVLKRIYLAGMFHDIGKVWVKKDILTKPHSLTPEEYEHVKQHAWLGAHCVRVYLALPHVADIVLHHHERIDGKGYPVGLSGKEIPLESRVIAVADAYDAMVGGPGGSSRQYRPKRTREEALKELIKGAGQQFDSEVVKVFCEMMEDNGSLFKKMFSGRLRKEEAMAEGAG